MFFCQRLLCLHEMLLIYTRGQVFTCGKSGKLKSKTWHIEIYFEMKMEYSDVPFKRKSFAKVISVLILKRFVFHVKCAFAFASMDFLPFFSAALHLLKTDNTFVAATTT